jgi:hypothetical protein
MCGGLAAGKCAELVCGETASANHGPCSLTIHRAAGLANLAAQLGSVPDFGLEQMAALFASLFVVRRFSLVAVGCIRLPVVSKRYEFDNDQIALGAFWFIFVALLPVHVAAFGSEVPRREAA